MELTRVLARLKRGDFVYLFGRFRTVRACYSRFRYVCEWGARNISEQESFQDTIFPALDIGAAVAAIRKDAVFTDIRLPAELTKEIETFCRAEPLFARQDPQGPAFLHAEIKNGYTPDGRPVAIAPITDPLRCEAVRRVVTDPVLNRLVAAYLGYVPKKVDTLLYWSVASSFTDVERRRLKQHVIDYHYDVGGLNFLYVSFYILDCTVGSGAHVMMKGSHLRKPLRWLLGSAVADEEAVRTFYGRENELVIEGPAGTGFIQDASCYHRASPPTIGDRLLLQLRFS